MSVKPQSERPAPATDSSGARAWGARLRACVERLIIILSLYVYSIGPLYWQWYAAKFVDGPPLLALFYEPLWHLAGWFPPLGRWLNWYVDLWM